MKNLEKLLRPNIRCLKPYSSARHEFEGDAELFLDANENPFDNGFNRYPDPLQTTLKRRISDIKGVKENQIFLGNGSDEAIDLLFRIFCEPGRDNVITMPPTYGMYQVAADIANVDLRKVPLNDNFQPDFDKLINSWDENTKIIFLCSPNNPTGNSLDPWIMEKILKDFDGIVVIDEAYIDFSIQPSFLELLGSYNNLVVMQTLSKAWGLAGIRLGMAFADKEIIDLFNKVKAPYNINQLTQEKALEVLNNTEKTKANIDIILKGRRLLESELAKFSYVLKIFPSDANFLLLKVKDADFLYKYLLSNKIVVRNRSKVHGCEGCLRISVGTPEENNILLDALRHFEQSEHN